MSAPTFSSRPFAMMGPHSMPLPLPMKQKRSFDETEEDGTDANVQRSVKTESDPDQRPRGPEVNRDEATMPGGTIRQASPAVSATLSSLSSVTATPPPPSSLNLNQSGSTSGSAPKRRKLTPGEKLEQQRAKEAKTKQRQEEKERREAEKLEKDQERQRKKEEQERKKRQQELEAAEKEKAKDQKRREKEEEQKKKDEKRREKEEVKKREDEERAKKERAQSRINSFFAKPKTPSKGPTAIEAVPKFLESPAKQRVAAPEDAKVTVDGVSSSIQQAELTDFERHFLPFSPRSDVTVAPANLHSWDSAALTHIQEEFDDAADSDSTRCSPMEMRDVLELGFFFKTLQPSITPTVMDLMESLDGIAETSIASVNSKSLSSTPIQILRQIPMKYLEFAEDVRPPYVGTNTQIRSVMEARRLARNPCTKLRADVNYDYDSEAEWEEPEEGEDILSEGESDSESEADDMEDFLDDEENADGQKLKKGFLKVDMQPVSTGLCFEDVNGRPSEVPKMEGLDFEDLRLAALDARLLTDYSTGSKRMSPAIFPIDPLDYGSKEIIDSKLMETGKGVSRTPLQNKSTDQNLGNTMFLQSSSNAPKPEKACKVLEGPDLAAFKDYVNGSRMSKSGVLAVLKSHFPKTTNDCLKATLASVATNLGKGRAGNHWVLVDNKHG